MAEERHRVLVKINGADDWLEFFAAETPPVGSEVVADGWVVSLDAPQGSDPRVFYGTRLRKVTEGNE